jgi:two-component system, NarL family, invasion response regulator UvrY
MIRVLIVSKHAFIRESLCALLKLSGSLQVICSSGNPHSVLRVVRSKHPLVILVDMEMPDDEGYGTIRLLKRMCPQLKFIALTAHDYTDARNRMTQAGADRVMLKGLGLDEMITAIVELSETVNGRYADYQSSAYQRK